MCVEVALARNEPSVRGGQSLLLCCCCAAAAVLLLSCCCAAAVVTNGYLFSVFLKKYAVLRDASRSFLFSIRDYLYFLVI